MNPHQHAHDDDLTVDELWQKYDNVPYGDIPKPALKRMVDSTPQEQSFRRLLLGGKTRQQVAVYAAQGHAAHDVVGWWNTPGDQLPEGWQQESVDSWAAMDGVPSVPVEVRLYMGGNNGTFWPDSVSIDIEATAEPYVLLHEYTHYLESLRESDLTDSGHHPEWAGLFLKELAHHATLKVVKSFKREFDYFDVKVAA